MKIFIDAQLSSKYLPTDIRYLVTPIITAVVFELTFVLSVFFLYFGGNKGSSSSIDKFSLIMGLAIIFLSLPVIYNLVHKLQTRKDAVNLKKYGKKFRAEVLDVNKVKILSLSGVKYSWQVLCELSTSLDREKPRYISDFSKAHYKPNIKNSKVDVYVGKDNSYYVDLNELVSPAQ